jgi:drug/metabolite transporter (DMT)-like permease
VSGGVRNGAKWGVVLAATSAISFSAKAIFVKLAFAAAPVDAVTLLTLRMAYAAPIYAALLWWSSRGAGRWSRRDRIAVGALGFLGYYLASLLDFLGLAYISAALERLVLFLYPTIVVVISAAMGRHRIGRVELAALGLSYAGIATVVWNDVGLDPDAHRVWIGCALVFGSAIAYSIYLVGAQPLVRRLGSIRFTAAAMLVSCACTLVHFGATRPVTMLVQTPGVHGLSIAMAIVSTVIPTLLLAAAIKRIGSDRVVLVGSIGPIATIALGVVVLDEPLSAAQIVGAALVLGGVVLAGRASRPHASPGAATSSAQLGTAE